MKVVLYKSRVLFEVWFAYMSAYRAEIVIWLLTGSLPLIMLAVWIGKATTSGGAIGDFTPQNFAAYFLSAWLTQQLIVAWVSWELNYQIRMGELSPKLLRPFDPLWEHLTAHITERMVRAPFMLVVMLAGLMLVPGTRLTPDLAHALGYLVSVGMAFAIRFLIAYCVGLLAFWFEQSTAIDDLYHIIAAFLTGGFAPLDFYPSALRAAIEWTPFPYLVYYPVLMFNGSLAWPEMMRVLGIQAIWVLIFALLRVVLWRRGLRRYGAVGA